MNVVQVVTFIVAFALAASRILNATKPFWSVFPAWLARVMPALVVAVPALGQLIAGAQTWTDVSVAFLTAGALFMPGSASHLSAPASKPPSFPPIAGVTLLLLLSVASGATGCAWLKGSFWPKLETCAPSPAVLVSQVATILAVGGDQEEAALEDLAASDGKTAVECAVQAFISSVGGPEGDNNMAKARGREFLAKAGK